MEVVHGGDCEQYFLESNIKLAIQCTWAHNCVFRRYNSEDIITILWSLCAAITSLRQFTRQEIETRPHDIISNNLRSSTASMLGCKDIIAMLIAFQYCAHSILRMLDGSVCPSGLKSFYVWWELWIRADVVADSQLQKAEGRLNTTLF